MTTLDIRDLTVSFTQYAGRTSARRVLCCVKGLSLSLDAGEIVAVAGSSGSGKSLLAHAILGILPQNATMEGSLTFLGAPLTPARARALRGRALCLVPQGVSHLDPLMKVGPFLRRGRRDLPVRETLAQFGLGPEVEDLYPFQLSGGMARRVLIASAVLERPRLVIADEPTPGLDDATARRVMGHFRALADEGAAVLFITHDLGLAAQTADRVAVLNEGATEAVFPADQFGTVADPYVRALWRSMPEHGFGKEVDAP